MKKTSLFENALIWFGAGVSIAEILTGTYLAPLGLKNGILAIVAGHVIGCILLFLAGVIGGKMRLSAMDSTKMSFGQKGCLLFAALNVLQLVGWTAIMIYDGALAAYAYRCMDLVFDYWYLDSCMDWCWYYKPWKNQYSCDGCFICFDFNA